MRGTSASSRLSVIGALVLAACAGGDSSGCGGATCPFASVAFLAIEGTVLRADGSPYVADQRAGVYISVGPGVYGGSGVPTDAAGNYRVVLDLPYDPGGEAVEVALSAGLPAIAADTVPTRFSRDRAARPTTVANLRERP